ncbi:MAG TPA: hypothetical protein VJ875_10555 [Pyrinomonadaceae bacterium]|nr:hypothetical protein [Pyrinomonadaceae bacterium]
MNTKLNLFALTLIMCVCSALSQAQDNSVVELKNADILIMVKAKLPASLIVEKINTSKCSFDTFPSVLAELKYRGVPDDVLMAMVRAPHGGRPIAERNSTISEPVATRPDETESRSGDQPKTSADEPINNIGGVILRDRSESVYNARFYVAPMEEGFDGLIAALMIEKKLPISVVADESLADFIVVGGTNKGVHKWYDTVFTGYERDRAQGNIRMIRVRDKTVVWAAQKGDRSLWWGPLKKGGKRKVAERLVNEMKGDLFKEKF